MHKQLSEAALAYFPPKVIESLIPHRAPFLFLDEVHKITESKFAGYMTWEAGHPILQGHFPQMPIVPGVCQLEAFAQLSGVGIAHSSKKGVGNNSFIGVLAAVRNCSFHSRVMPMQRFDMTAEIRGLSPHSFLIKGAAYVSSQLACRAEFIISLDPKTVGVI
jgi:3-hydroxyacyl-[acyl-carrier-protein] dehydratase